MTNKTSQLPQEKTLFTNQAHLSHLRAKMLGYTFTKAVVVGAIVVGLLGAGTFQALAGNNNKNNGGGQKHTIKNVKKTTVKANAGNKNKYGNSNSRASVDNSVHINTGGGSRGGAMPSINRGGGNKNGGNNNKKKVVRKKVVRRTIDNSYIDNSTVDNSYVDDSYKEVDISVKQISECGDCYNNSVEYTYKKPTRTYTSPTKRYEHDYDNDKKESSYHGGKHTNNSYVENNNNSENYNDNSQYLDVSFPNYYE